MEPGQAADAGGGGGEPAEGDGTSRNVSGDDVICDTDRGLKGSEVREMLSCQMKGIIKT